MVGPIDAAACVRDAFLYAGSFMRAVGSPASEMGDHCWADRRFQQRWGREKASLP